MGTDETIDAGGADAAQPSALDMTNEKDRAALRRAATRWPKRVRGITEARKFGWLEDLDLVRKTARDTINSGGNFYPSGEGGVWETRLDGAKVLSSAIKTEAMLEAMNQADEHKAAQIDSDKEKPPGLTINAETVNIDALAKVAADPAAYAEFAKLADKVKGNGD